jgi:uncharacterized RDD family membrane protein YckC
MDNMTISCPHCNFSREVPQEKIPDRPGNLICPMCKQRFAWQQRLSPVSAGEQARRAPKAGFVLRCAAAVIDLVIYLAVLLLVIAGMGLIISTSGGDNPQALSMIGLLTGFVVLSFDYLYRVLFIGYCGQTPGKMTTRIKVIRCNGDEIGFGAAIFREIIGKFISLLLFMTGYIMVGFDEQRQGLHDKIADTYVIKL